MTGIIFIASPIIGGLLALYFLLKKNIKKFHVDIDPLEKKVLGINILPLFIFLMRLLPESMRRKMVTKQNAPTADQGRDLYDCTGKTPYNIKEIKPGTIWQVEYIMEQTTLTNKEAKLKAKEFGLDPNSKDYQEKCLQAAALFGEEALEVAKKDLETAKYWFNRDEIGDDEVFKAGHKPLRGFVVKLKSGSLLLYAPVRIREEVGFGSWLDSLGQVEWIVVASSMHTLHIKGVATRYPDAKIIGAPAAEDKLNFINALTRKKLDFISTDNSDLEAANDILRDEGLQLFSIDGDVCCNAIVAVVDNIAIECDLVYGHHDGEGMIHLDKETFRKFRPENWSDRLFKYAFISKPNSPHGFLATYRYQFMDPNSLLSLMTLDQPAYDGSSCQLMANSLRKLIKLDFDFAVGTHITLQSKEDFCKNIDASWNWLDGKTLH